MAGNNGKFIWYELMTSDTKAAETFYRNVIGLESDRFGHDRPVLYHHPRGGNADGRHSGHSSPGNWDAAEWERVRRG